MLQSITTLLALLVFYPCFSQQKDFEKFMRKVDSCKAHNGAVIYYDSLVQSANYELKWIHTRGTYGGSHYCCDGEVKRTNSNADTLFAGNDNDFSFFYPYGTAEISTVVIGDNYLVQTFTYPEPQPTSAIHYVYVIRYYEKVED